MADSLPKRVEAILGAVLGTDPANARPLPGATTPPWDSLAHLNLVLALQDEFGVAFSEQEMIAMTSAEAIVSVLRRKGLDA